MSKIKGFKEIITEAANNITKLSTNQISKITKNSDYLGDKVEGSKFLKTDKNNVAATYHIVYYNDMSAEYDVLKINIVNKNGAFTLTDDIEAVATEIEDKKDAIDILKKLRK